MPNTKISQRSFSGGELSPEMLGRIDDVKFQTGLALCRNYIVKPHGPVTNRPGFEFIAETKDSSKVSRLIPFTFSDSQTLALEFGEGYIRLFTLGAALMLAATPAAWGTGASYAIGDLVSTGGNNYYCAIAHTSGTFPTDLAAGKWALIHATVYEVPTPYQAADLFGIHYVQSGDVLTLVHPSYAPRELRRYANFEDGNPRWVFSTVSFGATLAAPDPPMVSDEGATEDKYDYYYVVTTVGSDGLESAHSGMGFVSSNLFETGCTITIDWTAVSGAVRYNVYKKQGGQFGFIGTTTETELLDDNIAPDMSRTPPIYDTVFNTANAYPRAVSYHEQRRCFAGTNSLPATLWMTKSGSERNMSYSIPVRDDDRIAVRVAAREANIIRHIVPLSELILLTNQAEWRVTSVNSDAITPSSISIKPQSYIGASDVQPTIVNNSLVYCAARGGHVRELGYNWQASGYVTGDLSLRATHLFDGFTLADQCYSKAPYPVLWFVSSSGKLLGFTYIPEQQIGGWHQHDTDGLFESCVSLPEGTEDALYVIVNRTIGGNTKRYVERMSVQLFGDLEDCFFVDSGLTYDGRSTDGSTMTLTGGTTWGPEETLTLTASTAKFSHPALTDVGDEVVLMLGDDEYRLRIVGLTSTTVASVVVDRTPPVALRSNATADWAFARDSISGLSHLEGETVSVLAEGAVQNSKVVSSGAITLDVPAYLVHAGLPIVADVKTLPAVLQAEAFGQGRFKNVNKAYPRVYRTSGVWAGPDEDHLVEYKTRTAEPYGEPPSLKSEEIEILLTPAWGAEGSVFIRHTDPLPITILGITLDIAIGG